MVFFFLNIVIGINRIWWTKRYAQRYAVIGEVFEQSRETCNATRRKTNYTVYAVQAPAPPRPSLLSRYQIAPGKNVNDCSWRT